MYKKMGGYGPSIALASGGSWLIIISRCCAGSSAMIAFIVLANVLRCCSLRCFRLAKVASRSSFRVASGRFIKTIIWVVANAFSVDSSNLSQRHAILDLARSTLLSAGSVATALIIWIRASALCLSAIATNSRNLLSSIVIRWFSGASASIFTIDSSAAGTSFSAIFHHHMEDILLTHPCLLRRRLIRQLCSGFGLCSTG